MAEQTMSVSTTSIESYVEIRSATSPAVSPDGEVIAYLSDESGFAQIWTKPASGGQARRLTDMSEPVGALAFNPQGSDLVFTVDDGGDERHQIWLFPDGADAPLALTEDPTTVHVWGCWSPDGSTIAFGSNARLRTGVDIHLMDVASRATRCVLEADGYREPLAFFKDGKALLVRDSRRASKDQDLYRLDLETGAYEPLLPHTGRACYPVAKMLKDGSGLLVATDRLRDFVSLYEVSFGSDALRPVIEGEDCDVEAFAVSPDNARLAIVVNRRGWSELILKDRGSGQETVLAGHPQGVISSPAWTPDGGRLVFALDGASAPPAVWGYDLAAQRFECLARPETRGVESAGFVEPTVETLASFDGLEIGYFLYRPGGEAPPEGHPAIVIVHGGPEAQWRPTFRADIQYLLAQGIAVVAPNVRGSTGYGRRFHELDDRERRLDSVADLKAVRLAIGERSDIDASRIAVFGRSYGGFMVLSALTEYPDLWRFGVEFYGIANFLTMLQTTGPWRRTLRAAEYGEPDEMKALLERFSPINRIDEIAVPLLIVQGMDDPRVPPGESEMVFSCLRGLGRTVDYLRIPHAGHGFPRLTDQRTVFGAFAEFVHRHL
ncbi:S9 family peptidase [Consotaella aegiceratis]|uniref:S9 family peptidase n=1 Tax=Consotaella aegiceratis TaxID=3097961 RepID=UPI002F3EBFE6